MKKVALLLIVIVTTIRTIPTIYLNTSDRHTSAFYNQSANKSSRPLAGKKPDLFNENTGNTTNQGLAIEVGGKIYYSDGTSLWSMNGDETSITQIKQDIYPVSIQVLGDVIYYIHGETNEIYKINKDGTQNKKISKDKAYSLNIYKDKLYFIDRYNKLYITAMSLDGTNKTVIREVVANDMMIYNDYIYYITRGGVLGKVTMDGQSSTLLATDVMQFDVAKSGIYYTYDPRKEHNERGLYRLGFLDNTRTQLTKETPYSFNAYEDHIYYNHPNKMSLYKMLFDGTQKREITGANVSDINIAGPYIFYKNLEDGKKIYRINQNGANRIALQGKVAITNVTDLTKEIHELEGKEIAPKLKRAYNNAEDIIGKIIKPHMPDYEKAKIIHDYIVNNTRYDRETAERFLQGEASDANAFTAYGVLINKKAVCQGYAEATQILLSLAGIPSELVIGYVEDGEGGYVSHMWNMIFIHNKCYMIDTTWDDPVGPEDVLIYDYFLVDGDTLRQDHYWAYDEYPVCN